MSFYVYICIPCTVFEQINFCCTLISHKFHKRRIGLGSYPVPPRIWISNCWQIRYWIRLVSFSSTPVAVSIPGASRPPPISCLLCNTLYFSSFVLFTDVDPKLWDQRPPLVCRSDVDLGLLFIIPI